MEAMSVKGVTKSGLPKAAHVDRSTIGQLLKRDQTAPAKTRNWLRMRQRRLV